MLADPQKQKLVYDLFLEKVRQDGTLKTLKGIIPDEKDIEIFQAKYDVCVKLVELLKL